MTDGFPELFDSDGRMLGYQRAADIFGKAAGPSATDVLASLLAEAAILGRRPRPRRRHDVSGGEEGARLK